MKDIKFKTLRVRLNKRYLGTSVYIYKCFELKTNFSKFFFGNYKHLDVDRRSLVRFI